MLQVSLSVVTDDKTCCNSVEANKMYQYVLRQRATRMLYMMNECIKKFDVALPTDPPKPRDADNVAVGEQLTLY